MTAAVEPVLAEAVEIIVDQADPEQIYLFGSRARGNARPDSDVDLLVVEREPFGPNRSRRREMSRLCLALANLPVAADVLVYACEELDHWRHARNHVIAHALRDGRLLYERP